MRPSLSKRLRTGGLAAWSLRHPIGVVMIALAIIVLGAVSLARLQIDLLPKLIYPDVRVRIIDPGVPAAVMEDQITRQLEEQLAITEGVISVQSRTSEGRTGVDLSFPYGTDINEALRDASARLDRAKRFLPTSIDPPVIYKRDPSQLPVAEFVVSSPLRDPVNLRTWVSDEFSNWFLTVPGVASTEPGGGLEREIHVVPDPNRLSALGLSLADLRDALNESNQDAPAGRLYTQRREIGSRTRGRFQTIDDIAALPLEAESVEGETRIVRLDQVARVLDTHEDERLYVRVNGTPGIKLTIQKQPEANTVSVVDATLERLRWLEEQDLIPDDIDVRMVGDQAVYVRHALNNAQQAALSGAVLAMLVVYLFLGNLRRTLIIGSVLPVAIMITFSLMDVGNLTLNIMTLGGLALGIGLLVDNTIVMMENISRHQAKDDDPAEAAATAAAEVNSAVVAATSTNLAAILPFLFVGGLVGLLFEELIFTIASAIAASMLVALTLVPSLAGGVKDAKPGLIRRMTDGMVGILQKIVAGIVGLALKAPLILPLLLLSGAFVVGTDLLERKQSFLPKMDEGRVRMSIQGDPGIALHDMDEAISRIESILLSDPQVDTLFTTVGGFIFGRSEYQASNRSSIQIQLRHSAGGRLDSEGWVKKMNKRIKKEQLVGFKVRMRVSSVRGVRLSRGDDDISIRIQGGDIGKLAEAGDEIINRLGDVKGLRNLTHSLDETRQELNVVLDRERLTDRGLTAKDIGDALKIALDGDVISDFLDGDKSFPIRLRLARSNVADPEDVEQLIIQTNDGQSLRLRDVAHVEISASPANINRDSQRRIVEISASVKGDSSLSEVRQAIDVALEGLVLPKGYALYDGGATEQLRKSQGQASSLLILALFLVFVVMAVQYESLRDPLVIILTVPTAVIGVWIGLEISQLPLSMPVWLGMIMLAGIVVNNAIVLVEFIELQREEGMELKAAIIEAVKVRLRPILMTTLTTVMGMLPLALALGDGAEMLQPLAVTIVSGLSFAMIVSLLAVPCVYYLMAGILPARSYAVPSAQ